MSETPEPTPSKRNADECGESEMAERLWEEHRALVKASNDLDQQLWHIQRERDRVGRELRRNRAQLMNHCDHDWVCEPPMYQERTWHTCSKCGNMQ